MAMPSLSPLSTLSMRRTRTGTAVSEITGCPSAASVGARELPMRSATASGIGRPRHGRDEGAQRDGERQPDGEEPDDHARVLAERADLDEGRVREQDQGQGQLGEQAHGLGARIDIDHAQTRRARARSPRTRPLARSSDGRAPPR